MIPVYYRGIAVFDFMSPADIRRLKKNNFIYYSQRQNRYILKPETPLPHLIASGPDWQKSKEKRLHYFSILNEKKLTCEDCGAPDSFHIRPVITEGQANFREFVCTCHMCRKRILNSHDIFVPHFRRSYSVKTIMDRWRVSLEKQYVPAEVSLIMNNPALVKERIVLSKQYGMTKLSIPALRNNNTDFYELNKQTLLDSLGLLSDYEPFELNKQTRDLLRDFFFRETYGQCPCCEIPYSEEVPPTVDHIRSRHDGGEDILINLFGLCEDCNKKKSSDSVLEHLLRKEYRNLPVRVRTVAIEQQRIIKRKLSERNHAFNRRVKNFIYEMRKY